MSGLGEWFNGLRTDLYEQKDSRQVGQKLKQQRVLASRSQEKDVNARRGIIKE